MTGVNWAFAQITTIKYGFRPWCLRTLLFLAASACPSIGLMGAEFQLDLTILADNAQNVRTEFARRAVEIRDAREAEPTQGPSPGPYFSASAFPASGMLVRDGAFACSGTLVAPDLFLTAAHCVCEKPGNDVFPNAAACRLGTGVAHSTQVFLPTVGLLEIRGEPIVHDNFHYVKFTVKDIESGNFPKGPIGDVAVVRLERPVGVPPIPIGVPSQADILSFFGFGQSFISGDDRNKIPKGHYDGFPIATFLPSVKRCLPQIPDMLCLVYDPVQSTNDPQSLTCTGDSGGAILALNAGAGFSLRGVASAVISNVDCSASFGKGTFTDLAPYREWILSLAAMSAAGPPSQQNCGDGFVKVDHEHSPLRVTLTAAVDKTRVLLTPSEAITLSWPPGARLCSVLFTYQALLACGLNAQDQLSFDAAGLGGVQVMMCEPGKGD